MSAPYERKTPEWIHRRREGALQSVLESGTAHPGLAIECAKIEALFLIAEQLTVLNEKLEVEALFEAIKKVVEKVEQMDEALR